jgi:acetate kinase
VLDAGAGSDEVKRVATGSVERIGGRGRASISCSDEQHERETETRDHREAFGIAQGLLEQAGCLGDIDGVGHRVVHGGLRFRASTRIDAEVIDAIREVSVLAPLHNKPALAVIEAAAEAFGAEMPAVAAFDTAYFADLPDEASRYAIPKDLSDRYGIRRFGFHGLAHGDMVRRFQTLRPEVLRPRLITLMLGGGCSVTASFDGSPVDTSMGYTPLEGLVMGTRSGDIDPALPLRLQALTGMSPEDVEDLLNTRSGLLGLSGRSGEMRDLVPAAANGDEDAAFAVEMFCRSARKYVGAYLALLGGADAVIFSGGIGENMPEVRKGICQALEWAGLTLDDGANASASGPEVKIAGRESRIDAWVIRADEAAVIARETVALLTA